MTSHSLHINKVPGYYLVYCIMLFAACLSYNYKKHSFNENYKQMQEELSLIRVERDSLKKELEIELKNNRQIVTKKKSIHNDHGLITIN